MLSHSEAPVEVPPCAKIVIQNPSDEEVTEEDVAVAKSILEFMEIRKELVFDAYESNALLVPTQATPVFPTKAANRPTHRKREDPAASGQVPLNWDPFEGVAVGPFSEHKFEAVRGIYTVTDVAGRPCDFMARVPSAEVFFGHLSKLNLLCTDGPAKTYCYRRLELLEAKFNLHCLLNEQTETREQKGIPHRDLYNVRKIDTHVHAASAMNQKHILRFIKRKFKECGDEVVIFRDGRYLTLAGVFESLGMTPYDLSVDTLDMHADKSMFHRFDRFNLKYNPAGASRLREIFMKTDNFINGTYFAELLKEVFQDLDDSKYQLSEPRISIYGRKRNEWEMLGKWVVANRVYSANIRWLVQIPRLYNVHKGLGNVESFQDMLDNIFVPLFRVSIDPSVDPDLHKFLTLVVGFDCVDDESKPEKRGQAVPPAEWTFPHNPPYNYYMYYLFANLKALNLLRESKGMNTFAFRPHCGEAGDPEHLAPAFLTSNGINHGLMLRKTPVLQYLYYLTRIGVAMSPLSNNSLFLDYHKNPLPMYFARGLNVSLSTDDPLQFHFTREPLMEEYSIAAQVWKLSNTDLCELAANSVRQSGFSHELKQKWLGAKYNDDGLEANDIRKTNIPYSRFNFRREIYNEEMAHLHNYANATPLPAAPGSPKFMGSVAPLKL